MTHDSIVGDMPSINLLVDEVMGEVLKFLNRTRAQYLLGNSSGMVPRMTLR